MGKTDNNRETVRMSSQVRSALKAIKSEIEELSVIQKKQEEKVEKKKAKVVKNLDLWIFGGNYNDVFKRFVGQNS